MVAHARAGVGSTETDRRTLAVADADVRVIVAAEIVERTAAADEYEEAGRADRAARLRAEAAVLEGVLAA